MMAEERIIRFNANHQRSFVVIVALGEDNVLREYHVEGATDDIVRKGRKIGIALKPATTIRSKLSEEATKTRPNQVSVFSEKEWARLEEKAQKVIRGELEAGVFPDETTKG